jgi:hypothetical protein
MMLWMAGKMIADMTDGCCAAALTQMALLSFVPLTGSRTRPRAKGGSTGLGVPALSMLR